MSATSMAAALPPSPQTARGHHLAAWMTSGAFAALMLVSGTLYLVGPRPILEMLRPLGYPFYFVKLLGAAKILGAIALLAPVRPTLREWAYAGFAFDLMAAVASHMAIGDVSHVGPAVFALALLGASYLLRRRLQPSVARTTSRELDAGASEMPMPTPPRRSIWFGRFVLGAATVLLVRIALAYVLDPVGSVAPHHIDLGSAEAVTIMRAMGGVFLGIALVLASCVVSDRRLLPGLGFLAVVATSITVVRLAGLVVDGPAPFTLMVLRPEIALVVLSTAAFFVERHRRRRAPLAAGAAR